MTHVGRATQGTGGADLPASTGEGAHSGAVESGSGASSPGKSPALEDMPQEGSGRRAAFSISRPPADRSDPTGHLLAFQYTLDQLGSVTERHGREGLEALRVAHGHLSAALTHSEAEGRRKQLTEIARRSDGVTVLRAFSQHWETLFNGASISNILSLAKEADGATKLASLADLLASGYSYKRLADVMEQHGSKALEPLSIADNKMSAGSPSEESAALQARLLGIACKEDGVTVLNAISEHGQKLSTTASAAQVLDVAEQPGGAMRLASLATLTDAQRSLANMIGQHMRDAGRPA